MAKRSWVTGLSMLATYLRVNIAWVFLTLKCCGSRRVCFMRLVVLCISWCRRSYILKEKRAPQRRMKLCIFCIVSIFNFGYDVFKYPYKRSFSNTQLFESWVYSDYIFSFCWCTAMEINVYRVLMNLLLLK